MIPVSSLNGNLEDFSIPNPYAVPNVSPDTSITDTIRVYLASHVTNKHTRRGYEKHLMDAAEMMGVETMAEIQPTHLVMFYQVTMSDHRGSASHAAALIALRSFLLWASAMGGHHLNMNQVKYLLPVPGTTVIRPHVALTKPEIAKMLASSRAMGKREFALLPVAFGSGLRLSELVHLDCSDFLDDAEGGTTLHVRCGKGAKDRMVPVRKEVRQAVEAYLSVTGRQIGDLGPLFQSEDRALSGRESWRLSTKTAGAIIRESAKRAGIRKRVSPHALRHSFASSCYLYSRKDLVAVSKLLGHSSIKTTLRYVDHFALLDLRKAIPPYLAGGRGPSVRPE